MILKEAITYIGLGWAIFPLFGIENGNCMCSQGAACSDTGKHPILANGLKGATTNEDKIREWWGTTGLYRKSNIAIRTGEKSGLTVYDIDMGPGKKGSETWTAATKERGEPKTLMAQTGGGGCHVLFKYNSFLKTASNVLGPNVDVRNDGGYIVAPPSLHKSGQRYKWLNWGTVIASVPAYLSGQKDVRGRPKKDDALRARYSVEEIRSMLDVIPADDRDLWRNIGIILGREFQQHESAWELYKDWSNTWKGKKGRNHDKIMHECFYELSRDAAHKMLTIGTVVKAALDHDWHPTGGEVPAESFVFYGATNSYIYRPTGTQWIAGAVDAAVSPINSNGKLVKASDYLKAQRLVTSLTCDPSMDEDYLKGYDASNGELTAQVGAAVFNTYRPPTIELGDSRLASPFTDHVKLLLNKTGDADQFLDYLAHRVQKPWEKPRFALLIAGGQGVGKDTIIEFCCPAIGPWNVANIDPSAFDSGFNEYCSAVLVRISEAANLHEMSKWSFNERTKVLIAGSPDLVAINPKYGQKYTMRMICGVVLTTNHLTSGIYVPADDRRYDIMECATMVEMKLEDERKRRVYFETLWDWFLNEGGNRHVAAYLRERNIAKFSASNGQRKTLAHSAVVRAGMASDEWLDDVLEHYGKPPALRADWILSRAVQNGEKDGDVRRKMTMAISRCGYHIYYNPNTRDGRWKIAGKNSMVYVKDSWEVNGFDPTKDLTQEPL